jgi:hypothetical protein
MREFLIRWLRCLSVWLQFETLKHRNMDKIILTCTFTIIAFTSFGQNKRAPIIFYSHGNSSKVELKEHEGYLVTISNDTIRGKVILGRFTKKKDGIQIATDGKLHFYSLDNVALVRLNSHDSTINDFGYTDFKILGKKPAIYRVLARDKIEVYDRLLYTNEKIGSLGEEIFVKDDDKLVSTFKFWGWTRKTDLLSFVNSRYKTNFSKKDFASSVSMIKYISEKG